MSLSQNELENEGRGKWAPGAQELAGRDPPQHGRRVSHSRPPREWVNDHVRTANHTPWNQQVCPGRGSSIQQGALGRVNLFPPRPYLTGAKPQQAPDPAMHTHTQTHGPDCHGQRSDHPHNVWVLTSKIRL